MKKENIAILLSLLSIIGLIFVVVKKEAPKIAYVNNIKVLSEYDGMKMANKELQKKLTVWQRNVDTLASEFQQRAKQYEEEKNSLSPSEQKVTEELLISKEKQFYQYRDAIQQKMQEEDKRVTEGVLKIVNGKIQEYGKKNGYDILLGANTSGNIVYSNDIYDITDEVLEILNKQYEGE